MSTGETQSVWFRHYLLALMEEIGLSRDIDTKGDIPIYGQTCMGWLRAI